MTETDSQKKRIINNFANGKIQCLGKRDKSSAGRIDPHVVDICAVINEYPEFYTTSSCAGRCFLYRGPGIKSTTSFQRFRVNHDKVLEPYRYFDLSTLETDPTGGGDPIRTIGQFDHLKSEAADSDDIESKSTKSYDELLDTTAEGNSIWLRYEPFILHVACRSMKAAAKLMAAARPQFKNVGLTTWKDSRYLLVIWGDEGLDLPLTTPDGSALYIGLSEWLAKLVNERQDRNWGKIDRFALAARDMEFEGEGEDFITVEDTTAGVSVPRSYDVVGDVAILQQSFSSSAEQRTEEEWEETGKAIMKRNKAIKVVALKTANLEGQERANTSLKIIAGTQRSPLITSHSEYGIKCVVDLNKTFFSPRMGQERLRICQQIARGEHVLVLFAGVAMEAMQIAGRTQAETVTSVEINPVAVECSRRSRQLLGRNKAVKCEGAAERLHIMEGDALEILPTLTHNHFDRVLAPRPKEGDQDGDLGRGDGGLEFLVTILLVLKADGGECHWYDFVADHEYPACERSKNMILMTCSSLKLDVDFLHVARVGSVAMRQLRVCIDFRVKKQVETSGILQF